ncbi:MAG: HAD-IA family hydrolase [Burkholderia gladioli]
MSAPTFLFDLDGTLVDTDALHLNAFNALLARWQRSIDLAYYKANVMGAPDSMIFGGLFPGMPADEYTALAADKERMFREQLSARLTPTAGAEALLDHLERIGARRAVVTNAPRENATLMLAALGFDTRFEVLVIGGELAHGKPHPLPYLTALERVGGDAAHAVAFEDSGSGVRSASAAGIHTFGMLTALSDAQLREAGAHATIRDFTDPALWAWIEGGHG